jgi:hypothetical protein
MSSKKSDRFNKMVSLRVKWNPATGQFQFPAFIEVARDEFVSNPASEIFRERKSVKEAASVVLPDSSTAIN